MNDAIAMIREWGGDGLAYRMSFELTRFGGAIPMTVLFGGPDRQVLVCAETRRPLPVDLAPKMLVTMGPICLLPDGRFVAHSGTTVEDICDFDDELPYLVDQVVDHLVLFVRQAEMILGGAADQIPSNDDLLAMNLKLTHFQAFDLLSDEE